MKVLIISLSIFLIIFSKAYSEITKQIVNTLEKSNNYSFKFIQKINEKKETGDCILVFDRKINCKYDNSGKILISDGKNLIVKYKNSNIPNFYKLENTTFYRLLDKQFLIDQLKENNVRSENDILFVDLNYQNIDIKIFFDKKKLYLKGWQTIDIYNNSVFTEIKIKKINENVSEELFNIKKFN